MQTNVQGPLVQVLRRAWLPVVLVAAWWIFSAGSESLYFPPLREIVATVDQVWIKNLFFSDLVPSVLKFLAGFLIAAVLGVLLGLIVGLSPVIRAATEPLMEFLRSIPAPVLLPVGILFFGIGDAMNIAIIAFGAIWPTLMNTIDGVRALDPQVRDMARSYQLTFGERIARIILPNAGPQIFTGLRTTLQLSIILIVVSEMVGSIRGIGYQVLMSQQRFAVLETWAGTVVLGVLGFLFTMIFLRVERRVLAWQFAMQGDTSALRQRDSVSS